MKAIERSTLTTEPASNQTDATALAFVDWAGHCSRSENLAALLGMHLIRHFRRRKSLLSLPYKYMYQFVWTMRDLFRIRPRYVICMSPSPLTALPVLIYCRFTSARYAIDAHTGAFLGWPWEDFPFFQRYFTRRADVTLVTNHRIAQLVQGAGGRPLLIPDVPTEQHAPGKLRLPAGTKVLFAASFGPDEPINLVVQAARRLPDVHFYITGTPPDAVHQLLDPSPENMSLTGFVSRASYLDLLASTDFVLALTTRNHTMQRAAYEAIYLGTPLVASDWPVLRDNFAGAAIFTKNDCHSLVEAIKKASQSLPILRQGALKLREEKLLRWNENKAALESRLKRTE